MSLQPDRRGGRSAIQAQDFVELDGEGAVVNDLDVLPITLLALRLGDLSQPGGLIIVNGGSRGRRPAVFRVRHGWETLHEEAMVFAVHFVAFVGVSGLRDINQLATKGERR